MIAARQRSGCTLTLVAKAEAAGVDFARAVVMPGAKIFADEAPHWDSLEAHFPTGRINHSEAYSADGANTNQAENFFSRLRRMIVGQNHKVSFH